MQFNNFLILITLLFTVVFADYDLNEREYDDWYKYERALYPNNFHRKRDDGDKRDWPIFSFYKRDAFASPKAYFYYYKLQKSGNESNKQNEDKESNGQDVENDNNKKRNSKAIPYYFSSPGNYYLHYKKEVTSPYHYYKRESPSYYDIKQDDSP
ncbi:9593_t:CDS:2 [Scutellospora calospora]|uniref:9593_t:CDS:1 n=1 Tax=Scutellospora calospora TaxID=85575 RepID=A0ACA9KRC3_9GLOM|nr:9593_t:CDS:2 [Scutellospora calospora]